MSLHGLAFVYVEHLRLGKGVLSITKALSLDVQFPVIGLEASDPWILNETVFFKNVQKILPKDPDRVFHLAHN